MKKQFWIAGLILCLLILFAEYDLTKRIHRGANRVVATATRSASASTNEVNEVIANKGKLLPGAKTKEQGRLNFDNLFLRQAQQIGQIQNDPASVELELKTLSKQMLPKDIKHMREIAEDTKNSGDDRALAIELLSRNQTADALDELAGFIARHEKSAGQNWNRAREFETILRAQAIEGIGIYPEHATAESVLQKIDEKISESFLKDRIARTRASLKGIAPTPDQQDEQALRKLVE